MRTAGVVARTATGLLAGLVLAPCVHAATFTVTSTADTAGTTCGAPCTLRQAIGAANAMSDADTIAFNIAGSGVHTIAPATVLPTIIHPVTIDGYTQPGSAVNTASVGTNAVLQIELSGAGIAAGANGLSTTVNTTPVTIRGLAINGFLNGAGGGKGVGIKFFGGSGTGGGAIKGCFLGTDATGTLARGNQQAGLNIQSDNNTIGGIALADRNLISGNFEGLIIATQSTGNTVQGNVIGLASDGISALGNEREGIYVGGNDNLIGGTTAGNGNVISGNGLQGVLVASSTSGNTIQRNSIFANGQIGIDLGTTLFGDGATPNDAGDADTGANNLQNFPVLTAAGVSGTTLTVAGSLNSNPSRAYRIEFFDSSNVDASGFGEGQFFIGSSNVSTNAGGNATIFVSGAVPGIASRQYITATATDTTTGDTSEFSAAIVATTNTTVVNTNDSGNGSLRQAILNANSNAGTDLIDFAIPGAGLHLISPLTPLPTISDTVTIDGYTQAGSSLNTLAEGTNARLKVQLDGSNLVAPQNLLSICATNSIVRGLALTGSPGRGLTFGFTSTQGSCAAGSANGSQLSGSFVGLDPDGTTAPNLIGILIGQSAVKIGAASAAERNVVSGNQSIGITSSSASAPTIIGNLIGWAPDGTTARGNGGSGVLLGTSVGATLGQADAPNRIGNNVVGTTVVPTASGNALFANDFTSNADLGIDLCDPGCGDVTGNDLDDTDTGANNLQNFPDNVNVSRIPGGLHIDATLDRTSVAGAIAFTIGVYASDTCALFGNGEGERYLGSFTFNSGTPAAEAIDQDFMTDAPIPIASQITLTATSPNDNTSEFSACAPIDLPLTLVVTNTNDSGSGSLRQAILTANAHSGGDLITFDIPGDTVHVIAPASALPNVSDAVTIDGYTQPGATPNTAPSGSNAKLRIELDGSALATGAALRVSGDNVTIRGLAVVNAQQLGILLANLPPIHNPVVQGNFIGLGADGLSVMGNKLFGLAVTEAIGATIGGAEAGARNVISGNGTVASFSGDILVGGDQGPSRARIVGNLIGTNAQGVTIANPRFGVLVQYDVAGTIIGGDSAGESNLIAGHPAGGVVMTSNGTPDGVTIAGNAFVANPGMAIDLSNDVFDGDGVTFNDTNDADAGPNLHQNFPLLGQTQVVGGQLEISGTLDVPSATSNALYTIRVYLSAACDPNGHGEGEQFLGAQVVTLSGSAEAFSFTLPLTLLPGGVITATATDPGGNTSEFSACSTLIAPPNVIFSSSFEL